MAESGAAAPTQAGVAVNVFVGQKDLFLTRAKQWADQLVKAVKATGEKGLAVELMPKEQAAFAAALGAAAAKAATEAGLTAKSLKPHLGGLPESTLVLLTHGLDGDTDDAGGLLIFKGGAAKDRREMMLFHLSFIVVEGGKLVAGKNDKGETIDPSVKKEPGDEFSNAELLAQIQGWATVLQAIRDAAVWRRVVFAACGSSSQDPKAQPKLPRFAARFAKLTGKPVFFNRSPIWLEDVAPTFASVGKKNDDQSVAIETGTAFDGSGAVTLKSATDGFLPGAQVEAKP